MPPVKPQQLLPAAARLVHIRRQPSPACFLSSQIRQFAALLIRRRLNSLWRRLAPEPQERWAGPGRGWLRRHSRRLSTKHLPPVFQAQVPGPDGPSERNRVSIYPSYSGILSDSRLRFPPSGFLTSFSTPGRDLGSRDFTSRPRVEPQF